MKTKGKYRSLLEIHIATFLFGLTGLFGKFLNLNPIVIVFGRVFFSSIFLFNWLLITKQGFILKCRKDFMKLLGMGVLLAVHWVTFFASIQMSTVAIGLLTFSTFPVFVTAINAMLYKTSINGKEIFYGALTLLGIVFVLPLTGPNKGMLSGGAVGIVSGGIYAYYTIKNVELVRNYSGMKVAFYEHVVSSIFLLPALFYIKPVVTGQDIVLLILLGTVFTGIGHSLFINGLKNVGAYLASIIIMLEPIYAIVLAWALLGEGISFRVGIGAVIILFTVYRVSKD